MTAADKPRPDPYVLHGESMTLIVRPSPDGEAVELQLEDHDTDEALCVGLEGPEAVHVADALVAAHEYLDLPGVPDAR